LKTAEKKKIKSQSGSYFQIAVISLLLGLVIGSIIMLILGQNPLSAFYNFLQGCGIAPKSNYAGGKNQLSDFSSFIDYLTPMIFAALAVAIAMKAGLFNIGISGQMLFAGFMATILVGYSEIPSGIAKVLVVIIGILCGALMGGLIGFLKYKFNINEVVSSIMLNYIAEYIISFFINTMYVDPVSRQSTEISQSARLTLHQIKIGDIKYDIPIGFVIAIIAAVIIKFILDKTVLGYEIKAVGANKKAAEYAGIAVNKNILVTMGISGALSGLAGVTYYMGYLASIQPKTLSDLGFNSIAVSILGNNEPVGIFFSAIIVNIIDKGSTYMSSKTGLDAEIAPVITGVILLSSACGVMYRQYGKKIAEKLQEKKNAKEDVA